MTEAPWVTWLPWLLAVVGAALGARYASLAFALFPGGPVFAEGVAKLLAEGHADRALRLTPACAGCRPPPPRATPPLLRWRRASWR